MIDVNARIYRVAFGHTIAALRKGQGITQVEFCKTTGLSQPTLSRIERGLVLPDVLNFKIMAQALGQSIGQADELVDEILGKARMAAKQMTGTSHSSKNNRDHWDHVANVVGISGIDSLIRFAVAIVMNQNKEKSVGQKSD